MNHQKSKQTCAFCWAIKNFTIPVTVRIVIISVISFIFQNISLSFVGANLLQFSPPSIIRPFQVHKSRTLLPPNNPRQRPLHSVEDEMQNNKFYLNFLVAYGIYKKWEEAQLLFPRNEPSVCQYFRVNLLKEASIQATCHHSIFESLKSTTDNLTRKKPSGLTDVRLNATKFNTRMSLPLRDWALKKEMPTIACLFLPKLAKQMNDRVDVNPRVLIDYQPDMNILVISADQENTNAIIEQVQPEINTNYKWTLVSRMNESHMSVEDIFGLSTSSVPIRNNFAVWSQSTGLSIDYHRLLGPSNFEGRTIRITSVEGPPVVYLDRSSKEGIIKGSGYLPDIFLDTVASNLNLTYVLTTPSDNSFGSADENGNWSGMVGMLQRKETEVALMSFSYTIGRKKVMDFSPPVEYSSTRLLIRKDWANNELKWKAYSDPFDWNVWLAIPVIVCLGVCTFLIFAHFKLMRTTPVESVWLLSVCFLQQGQDEHSSIRNFPGRLVMGSFWVLAVVLYASYTARLTSFLAAATDKVPIKSLNEAVNNQHWKIGLVSGSSVPDRVKDSSVPEMMKMWNRVQLDKSGYVSGFNEGINRVYKERFVFFTTELIPSFLIKGNCSYTWVPGKFFSGFGYLGFQKNLPYASSISSQVSKIRETGQMKRLMRKWWGAESSCAVVPSSGGVIGMSLYETGTAFIVLIIGALLATAFLLIEFGLYLKTTVTAQMSTEQHSFPSSLAQSSNSSQTSIHILNTKRGNDLHSDSNLYHPPDPHHVPNKTNNIFVQLISPFHYLIRNERNTSMSTKWNTSKTNGSTFALQF